MTKQQELTMTKKREARDNQQTTNTVKKLNLKIKLEGARKH